MPTKEVHAPENAARASAGVLVAQEQSATLLPTVKETEKAIAPAPIAPTSPAPSSAVEPLQTYQGDVEKYVREKNVSVVSVAAAEAKRTEVKSLRVSNIMAQTEPLSGHSWRFYTAFIGGGAALIALALVLVYLVLGRTGQLPISAVPQAPFIVVDGVTDIPISPGESRGETLTNLTQEKGAGALSLGLIEQLRPIVASTSNQNSVTLVDTQQFLALLSPTIPVGLLRTLGPQFLLGTHSFNSPQPFLILKTDSYEQAFAGMLTWEGTMRQDLLPLFAYAPPAHINGDMSTTSVQTSLSQNGFSDAIVENHDARVLRNQSGDIYFLWTFLDRTTIVITTNEYTMREVITRLKDAPLLVQPGQ